MLDPISTLNSIVFDVAKHSTVPEFTIFGFHQWCPIQFLRKALILSYLVKLAPKNSMMALHFRPE